jgi:hypothetical protein
MSVTGLHTISAVVCCDCAYMLANGEDHSLDGEQAARMDRWDEPGYYLVLDSADPDEFSREQCDGCGTRQGGTRYPASFLPLR